MTNKLDPGTPIPNCQYFKWREFFITNRADYAPAPGTGFSQKLWDESTRKERANIRDLAQRLEVYRQAFGLPIKITSGFRSPALNKAVGGHLNSEHLQGKAADFVIVGKMPTDTVVVDTLKKTWPGGVGFYRTFIHLDLGEQKVWQ